MAVTEEGEVIHIESLWDIRPFDMIEPGVFVRAIHIGGHDQGVEARKLCISEDKMVMPDGRVEYIKSPKWGEVVEVDALPYYVRRGVEPPRCPND